MEIFWGSIGRLVEIFREFLEGQGHQLVFQGVLFLAFRIQTILRFSCQLQSILFSRYLLYFTRFAMEDGR